MEAFLKPKLVRRKFDNPNGLISFWLVFLHLKIPPANVSLQTMPYSVAS